MIDYIKKYLVTWAKCNCGDCFTCSEEAMLPTELATYYPAEPFMMEQQHEFS